MNTISLKAAAKINLCLSVLARRPDGYHEVEMLMQMVDLYDEVRVTAGGSGITVGCNDSAVPAGEGNIAYKAAAEMLKLSRRRTGLVVEIKKAIPVAAGLGGGSSDAAAVLTACNALLGTGLDRKGLAEIGVRLGMDVPFFFYGPTALASGRGEVLTELPPPAAFWVLLVNPGFETSTAWVYKNLNLRLTKKVDCNKIAGFSIGVAVEVLHNDLETVTAAAYPEIDVIKTELGAQGALGTLMSGSGPTVFGIFESEAACRKAATSLSGRGWRLYPAETLSGTPLAGYL